MAHYFLNLIRVSLALVWDYLRAQHLHPVLCTLALTFITRLTSKLLSVVLKQLKLHELLMFLLQSLVDLTIGIQLLDFLRTSLQQQSFLWIQDLGKHDAYLAVLLAALSIVTLFYYHAFQVKGIVALFSSPSAPVAITATILTARLLLTASAATLLSIVSGILVSRVLALFFAPPTALRMQ